MNPTHSPGLPGEAFALLSLGPNSPHQIAPPLAPFPQTPEPPVEIEQTIQLPDPQLPDQQLAVQQLADQPLADQPLADQPLDVQQLPAQGYPEYLKAGVNKGVEFMKVVADFVYTLSVAIYIKRIFNIADATPMKSGDVVRMYKYALMFVAGVLVLYVCVCHPHASKDFYTFVISCFTIFSECTKTCFAYMYTSTSPQVASVVHWNDQCRDAVVRALEQLRVAQTEDCMFVSRTNNDLFAFANAFKPLCQINNIWDGGAATSSCVEVSSTYKSLLQCIGPRLFK